REVVARAMAGEVGIGERRLEGGTQRPVADEDEGEPDATPPQLGVESDQVEQVLLLHQAADEEEDGDVRGDADRLPEAGVRVVGGNPAEVDATRPDLDVPDPLAGQLAGDAGGGGVDAGASPIEAAEQAPADRFERPHPVVAEV